jgi:hypothetical protein
MPGALRKMTGLVTGASIDDTPPCVLTETLRLLTETLWMRCQTF